MRRVIFTLFIFLFFAASASAQYLPNFQFGIKAGGNYSNFPGSANYSTKGDPGFQTGVYTRFGGLGLEFQPELYLQKSVVTISDPGEAGGINKSYFTTFNLPLLIGYKIGNDNLGGRIMTGPVLIFRLQNDQQFIDGQRLNYTDQNYGWQVGGGIDFHDLSIDIRYEAGLNKIGFGYGATENQSSKMNMISLSISYSLYSDYSLD
ncbi:outer membrane beta-barrel protein [Mucilaginibacter sp.]